MSQSDYLPFISSQNKFPDTSGDPQLKAAMGALSLLPEPGEDNCSIAVI